VLLGPENQVVRLDSNQLQVVFVAGVFRLLRQLLEHKTLHLCPSNLSGHRLEGMRYGLVELLDWRCRRSRGQMGWAFGLRPRWPGVNGKAML